MENNVVRVGIDGKLYNEINSYCTLNKLNTNKYINDLLKKEFLVSKYGDAPFLQQQEEKPMGQPFFVALRKEYVSPVTTVEIKEIIKPVEPVPTTPEHGPALKAKKRKLK